MILSLEERHEIDFDHVNIFEDASNEEYENNLDETTNIVGPRSHRTQAQAYEETRGGNSLFPQSPELLARCLSLSTGRHVETLREQYHIVPS